MSIMPNTAEFLPGVKNVPINFDFQADAGGATVSGTPNKHDLTKAVGQQVTNEKTDALKKEAGAKNDKVTGKPVSAASDPKAYHEQMLARYAQRRGNAPQFGRASQLRIEAEAAKHKMRSPQASLAEVQKKMNTQPQGMPQAKILAVTPEMQARRQPSVAARAGRAGLRLITATAEALAPTPVQGALMLLEAMAPQPRRTTDPQARRQPNIKQRMARYGAVLPQANFG